MKFAFSSNAFRRHSLTETIEILAAIGYQGIEIMADAPHAFPPQTGRKEIEAIQAALAHTGLEVSNINAFMMWAVGDTWHPSWIEPDPVQRAARVNHTLQCLDLAAELGCGIISTEPGGPLDGMEIEEGFALFRQGLLAVAERAREKGVRVLIEPEPELLIENSNQFLEFFQDLDPEIFGLNFDIGHFYCVGEDPVPLVQKLRRFTHHYHLEDIAASRKHHHLLPGKGAVDLPAVLGAIRDLDYRGFVTVELYPYEDRPEETARQAFHYLQEWAAK
jgi:sugar phosphate isomerase/epimerase